MESHLHQAARHLRAAVQHLYDGIEEFTQAEDFGTVHEYSMMLDGLRGSSLWFLGQNPTDGTLWAQLTKGDKFAEGVEYDTNGGYFVVPEQHVRKYSCGALVEVLEGT